MQKSFLALFLSALFLTLIAVPVLLANWIESGTPVCTDSSWQSRVRMVSDGSGGKVIAWMDFRLGDYYLYAQRIDSYCNEIWKKDGIRISDYEASQQNHVIESIGSGGSVILAWEDHITDPDIYCQILTPSGDPLLIGGDLELCTFGDDQLAPQLLYNDDGRIIVTWFDNRSGNWEIYAQRLSTEGEKLWSSYGEFIGGLGSDHLNSCMVTGYGGETIIAFEDSRYTDFDIYAHRFDTTGAVMWGSSGIDICTATGDQIEPRIVSDGNKSQGAIIAWRDFKITDYDIYAQRVDSDGNLLWTTNGVPVCTANEDQFHMEMISDKASIDRGAIIVWADYRYSYFEYDIYVQRIDALGNVLWTADGLKVCGAFGNQVWPQLAPDGSGGAIITWQDHRNSPNIEIYAQWVDASGNLLWEEDGVNLTVQTETQLNPQIVFEEGGPATVAWVDERNGNNDIYAQIVDMEGKVGYLPPVIKSVADVPGDQGGMVRLTIERSSWDDAQWYSMPAVTYNVWRRVDDPLLLSSIEKGTYDPAKGKVSQEFLQAADFPPGTWEITGSFAACQEQEYIYASGTLADSTSGGIPWSVYLVSVHMTTPSVWYMSAPDSGYSLDNIAPGVPLGLALACNTGSGNQLSWDPSPEPDFQYYRIYRGATEDFTPGPSSLVHETAEESWSDPEYDGWDVCYKVTALDHAGNESDAATPESVSGEDTTPAPSAFALYQNCPNPFNPKTTIRFDLPRASHVRLCVYNVKGQLVKTLVDEGMIEGRREIVWSGTNDNGGAVSSGVYFYRLVAGDFESIRKMVLVR